MGKLLYLLLFGFLTSCVYAETTPVYADSGIYNVTRLFGSSSDKYALPMFNLYNNRLLYYAAKGFNYGTDCWHIYRLDMLTEDISLYSTGFGNEWHVRQQDKDVHSFTSTAFRSIRKLQENKEQKFDEKFFCPELKCGQEKLDDDLVDACNGAHHEHIPGDAIFYFSLDGQVSSIGKYSDDDSKWTNQPLTYNSWSPYEAVYSESCDQGECVMLVTDDDEKPIPTKFKAGTFDGFNGNVNFAKDDIYQIFFHGYQTTDPAKLKAIKKGVISYKDSRIYKTTFDKLKTEQLDELNIISKDDPRYFYLPRSSEDGETALATGFDPVTKKYGTYVLGENKLPTLISDPNSNSIHATPEPGFKHIVFASDRDEDGFDTLFYGTYTLGFTPQAEYKQIKPIASPVLTRSIKGVYAYISNPKTNQLDIRKPVLSAYGVIMYLGAIQGSDCPQIYQVNTKWEDIAVHRKISTGFHSYESANFINRGLFTRDILFAATLTRDYKDHTKIQCSTRICFARNEQIKTDTVLKALCDGTKVEKSLPTDNEIYISNNLGAVQQRLTVNSVYDGEATTPNHGNFIVYSTYIDGDYELVKQNLDSKKPIEKLTNKLGFEGGVNHDFDSKCIFYYAYRPQTEEEKERYKQMAKYQFTDLAKTELYAYSFEKQKEYNLTNFGKRVHSIMWMEVESKVLFVVDDALKGVSWLYSIEYEYNFASFGSPVLIERIPFSRARDLSFTSNRLYGVNWVTYVSNYNLFVSKDFDPSPPEKPKDPDDNKPTNPDDNKPTNPDDNKPDDNKPDDNKPNRSTKSTWPYDDDGNNNNEDSPYWHVNTSPKLTINLVAIGSAILCIVWTL